MQNISIALNPTSEALSSADFKKSPETAVIDLKCQEPPSTPYNQLAVIKEFIEDLKAEVRQKKEKRREVEEVRQRAEQLRAIKQAYEWKLKKAENLKLAFAILTNTKAKIELIPTFEQKAFLETISENLNSVELWLLANKVTNIYEALDTEIKEITSGYDANLYYKYHEYKEDYVSITCSHNGEPNYEHGAYMPNAKLAEMETERNLISELALSSLINDLASYKPSQEEIDTMRQALEA